LQNPILQTVFFIPIILQYNALCVKRFFCLSALVDEKPKKVYNKKSVLKKKNINTQKGVFFWKM